MDPQPIDPLDAHRAHAATVVPAGDPLAIKRLYVELGELLEEAHGEDLDATPVLSLGEGHSVIVSLIMEVRGLVLDAGCGPRPTIGIGLGKDARRQVVALDFGLGTVRLARAIAKDERVSMLGIVGDLEALPFRAGAFQGIVCDDTIEHVPDDHAALHELARVLVTNGRLVLATPNRRNLMILRHRVRDRLRGQRLPASAYFRNNTHLREYTWPEFERLVQTVFRVRRTAGVGWAPTGPVQRLLNRLVDVRPVKRLSQMIVVEVERR